MPKLKVESQSKYPAAETFKKIQGLLENDRDLRKMDSGYTCQFDESAMTGTAKGSKFDADMRVTSQGENCKVEIDVNIPFMLTPVKGVIQSTLQKKLDAVLA